MRLIRASSVYLMVLGHKWYTKFCNSGIIALYSTKMLNCLSYSKEEEKYMSDIKEHNEFFKKYLHILHKELSSIN